MVDTQLVKHVALLARLDVPAERLQPLTNELGAIIGYVEQLKELDVSGVAPLTHAGAAHDVFRDDTIRPSLPRELVLSTAPRTEADCYLVPRVIGEA